MQNNTLKLLIKFPTRGRPEKFFSVLDQYIENAKDLSKIAFLISMDADDSTMNNDVIKLKLDSYKSRVKLVYFFGYSKSKIQAVNADMEKINGWDIVLLASDDMIPVIKGYDYVIRSDMNEYFRDTDGVLWYADGGQNNINTLSIMGKKFYDRFGYIYNPEYVSLWCDNEFTDVSRILKRTYKSDKVIIEHQHPAYQKTEYDELYMRNESYYNIDKDTYMRRSANNFDLDLKTPLFSILNPSVPEMSLFKARYDTPSKTLIGTHNSGFYSCINCLRISLYKLISQGIIPDKLSLSETLGWYKDHIGFDYYGFLYKKNSEKISELKYPFEFEIFCPTTLRHDKLNFENISPIEKAFFNPSDFVSANTEMFIKKYNIDLDNTIAVLYRGNDKWKETKLSSVEDWISVIESKYETGKRILIQTDEENAKNKFEAHFKDRCFSFNEIIVGNSHDTNIRPVNRKVEWAILFESIMRVISKCYKIINHSGNCALVPILYRGNLKGEIQFFEGTPYQYYKD